MCHGGNIIRVNLDNHFYRDVTKNTIEDFESLSFKDIKIKLGGASLDKRACMCGLFERASMQEEVGKTNKLFEKEAYQPLPFHKIEIEEHC